ncbi:sensor histidine kinase [Leptolyngbya sp. AN03gr2]|uniref:sensor histidine kinase n=1 Tax=unclassified Leptolyngbya TaxID=2650499 RepID=UPI003D316DD1
MSQDSYLVLNFSSTFRKTLRAIEWLLVVAFFSVYGFDTLSKGSIAEFWQIMGCLSGFLVLSWSFPTHRSGWQQQIYLAFGFLLVLAIRLMSLEWDLFLYFYIAKSCFLLERKSLIRTIITVTLLNFAVYFWTVLQLPQTNSLQIVRWMLQYAVTYFAILAFVVYLSLVVMTERKSRHRAELLAQQVETLAATLERTRIARDIHDSLGHLLTDLNTRLAVAQAMRDRDPIEAAKAVDMAKLLASQSITEVKRSLQIIRRSDFDLTQALTHLMEQLRHQNLNVQWELHLPVLPLSARHHLFCIVKEGLINVQKHSHASIVKLQSQFNDRELCLKLIDNGQGFDPALPQVGFGLKGIEERVQLLGGTFTIQSVIGSGTEIQITIPL